MIMIRRTGIGIWLFLAVSGVGIGCFSAFDNLYFQGLGYPVAVIGALTATFNISLAVAEIPSAMIFDRKSHWAAIQVGNGLRFIGLVIFFLALGPIGDFSAEALAGVGAAAMSGTSIAFILNRLGDVSDHERRRTIGLISVLGAGGSLLGGGIGMLGFFQEPRFVWGLGALFMAIAGLLFFFGRARTRHTAERAVEPLRAYLASLYAITRHPRAWLSITADAALIAPFLLWQLRLGSSSLWAVLTGFAIMKVAGIVGGRLVGHRRIGKHALYVLIGANVIAIIGFAVAANVAFIVACFGMHVLLHIAISVYCQAEFQAVVNDTQRAGASSVVSLLSSLVTGAAAVVVGALADVSTPLVAMAPSVGLYLAVALIAVVSSRDYRRESALMPEGVSNKEER